MIGIFKVLWKYNRRSSNKISVLWKENIYVIFWYGCDVLFFLNYFRVVILLNLRFCFRFEGSSVFLLVVG